MPAKKNTRAKSTAKPTQKKADSKKAAAKRVTKKSTTAARPRVAAPLTSAKPGDVLVLDSAQVGSPPREGEVLEVIRGEVRVSYRVRWPDGRQTLISPTGGTARIMRSSSRA